MDSGDAFETHILPKFAIHNNSNDLKTLEERNSWLKVFLSPPASDLGEAQRLFFTDGNGCVDILEKHSKFFQYFTANEHWTRIFGPLYAVFVANLAITVLDVNDEHHPVVDYDSTLDGNLKNIRRTG